jgi:hypothetical protein
MATPFLAILWQSQPQRAQRTQINVSATTFESPSINKFSTTDVGYVICDVRVNIFLGILYPTSRISHLTSSLNLFLTLDFFCSVFSVVSVHSVVHLSLATAKALGNPSPCKRPAPASA